MHRCYQVDPRNRCSRSSPKETFRWLGWGGAFQGFRRFPHYLILPHGIPRLASGATPCLFSTHARKSWRQAKVCLRPLVCFGQTRASRPPPLQHRVPTRAAGKSISRISQRRQPYPDCSGAFSVAGRPALGTGTKAWTYNGSVSASRHPGRTYEPLDVIIHCRRRATAILRYGRNPCVIQADTEPPGRLPPAPGSHFRRSTPSPGDLSLAQVWWRFPRLSSIPASIAFILTDSPAMMWALLHCLE